MLVLCCHDIIPEKTNVRESRFILPHSFTCSLGSVASRSVVGQKPWQKEIVEENLSLCGSQEAEKACALRLPPSCFLCTLSVPLLYQQKSLTFRKGLPRVCHSTCQSWGGNPSDLWFSPFLISCVLQLIVLSEPELMSQETILTGKYDRCAGL